MVLNLQRRYSVVSACIVDQKVEAATCATSNLLLCSLDVLGLIDLQFQNLNVKLRQIGYLLCITSSRKDSEPFVVLTMSSLN